MDYNNTSQSSDVPNESNKLNDVVLFYFVQYGVPYTVEHFMEIRESYYAQHQAYTS